MKIKIKNLNSTVSPKKIATIKKTKKNQNIAAHARELHPKRNSTYLVSGCERLSILNTVPQLVDWEKL